MSLRLQSWETRAIGSRVAGSMLRWVVGPGWEMVELIIAGGAEYFQSSSTAALLVGGVARTAQIVKTIFKYFNSYLVLVPGPDEEEPHKM